MGDIENKLGRALQVIGLYDAAADKFIAKVERGDARSKETYRDLKAAREHSRALFVGDRNEG